MHALNEIRVFKTPIYRLIRVPERSLEASDNLLLLTEIGRSPAICAMCVSFSCTSTH